MNNIENYIYKPRDEDWISTPVDESRCRYRLFEWHAHQCSRKPTRWILGYGFCTQHARIIERRLK